MEMNHERYLVVGTDDKTAEAIRVLLDRIGNYSFRSAVMSKKDAVFGPLNRLEIEELDLEELQLLEEHARDKTLEVLTALY